MADRRKLTRDMYDAYATGDRRVVENLLSEDFEFFSPPDPGIDRERYFEVCWPNSQRQKSFDYKRMVENGEEVIVTYEAERTDGSRFRNTEVLTFAGDKLRRAEVYFGWDL